MTTKQLIQKLSIKTWKIGTGAPFGPLEILDIIGIETAYNI